MRSAASTSASRLGSLNKGDVVAVTGIDNGWYKISFNGKTGYVRSDYMTITKEALSSRGTEAAAASRGQFQKQRRLSHMPSSIWV